MCDADDAMTYTPEERRAVNALKKVAKSWPKSLWLFSASGVLTVMKKTLDNRRMLTPNGSYDNDYAVDSIDIENDGGGW